MSNSVRSGLFTRFRRPFLYLGTIFAISVSGYLYQGWSGIDSVYMVVITMFGVGFEEVHPIVTTGGKIFTMFVVIGGWSAVFYTIGEVFSFVTQGEIMKAIGELKKNEVLHSGDSVIIIGRKHALPPALRDEVDREELL